MENIEISQGELRGTISKRNGKVLYTAYVPIGKLGYPDGLLLAGGTSSHAVADTIDEAFDEIITAFDSFNLMREP